MNEYELSQNKQLDSFVVKDLNKVSVLDHACLLAHCSNSILCTDTHNRIDQDCSFPFDDETFDKVTCVVSVDYLNKPRQVFDEIARVLRPGGECIISMSNRCFPTKAFRIWLQTNDLEHIFIVGSFFHYSGKFEVSYLRLCVTAVKRTDTHNRKRQPATCEDRSPNPGRSDPLYIVKAVKR